MVEGRATALKVRLADLAAGNVQADSRVNVMGVVVAVNKEEPPSFVIDDQSALILVRQFDKLPAPSLSQAVCVIGRARVYGEERYITSEIVKTVQPSWLQVRSLELANASSFVTPTITKPAPQDAVEEAVVDDIDVNAAVLRCIRTLDEGNGVPVDEVLARTGDGAEAAMQLLLRRGDIFEMTPGKVKILE